jgi:hypothetical protein
MQNNYQLLPDQADLQTRKKIHQAVLENSRWFGDGPPIMDEKFNAAQTDERRENFVEILRRAARRESNVGLSRAYTALADKLDFCGDEKCGSSRARPAGEPINVPPAQLKQESFTKCQNYYTVRNWSLLRLFQSIIASHAELCISLMFGNSIVA